MKTFTITLPNELAEFVEKAVADKKFDGAEHLIQYGISLVMSELWRDDQMTEAEREWLRKQLRIGTDQLDRGESVDGPAFMAGLLEKVEATQKAAS